MIQTYKKSIQISIDDLDPNINYNPNISRRMRITTLSVQMNDHSTSGDIQITVSCLVEHYLTADSEKTPIREGIIAPYTRSIYVKPDGVAFVNMINGVPFKLEDYAADNNITVEEALIELRDDVENYYMNEFEYFCYLYDNQAVVIKDMITSVIMRRHEAGDFN